MTVWVVCALALTGCASAPQAKSRQPRILCAAIPPHTKLEQTVLAGELPGDGAESRRWLEEYIALRLSCRAAKQTDAR